MLFNYIGHIEIERINTQLDLDLEHWLLLSLASTRTVLFFLH